MDITILTPSPCHVAETLKEAGLAAMVTRPAGGLAPTREQRQWTESRPSEGEVTVSCSPSQLRDASAGLDFLATGDGGRYTMRRAGADWTEMDLGADPQAVGAALREQV